MKVTKDTFEKYGKTSRVICPKCGQNHSLDLYRGSNGLGIGVSFVNYNHNYFALCPVCGSLYSVDDSALKISDSKIGKYKVKDLDPSGLTFLQTLPIK